MEVLDFDNVKAEKANAMLRYRRLRYIAKLFRLVELCLALVFLSWTSARLPILVKISGHYFRLLISIVVNPRFIFLLGNVIVLTLLAKSGNLTGQSTSTNNAETDLYDEFITSATCAGEISDASPPVPEEIVYQDKQMICEVNSAVIAPPKVESVANSVSDPKVYRRSQSENLKREFSEKNFGKLHRSDTDMHRRKYDDSAETPVVEMVEKLSNEEFQRTIEAFIAKQVKFHQKEKSAIVIPTDDADAHS